MVARAQAEGRRVLDVCVLTFLIRGINERRVSAYAYPYAYASSRYLAGPAATGASPIRGHTKRNWTPYTTRCVRGSASSPARPAGRRRQWRSGRACGSGVRSHVTRTRGGIYRTNLHCYAYFALSAARGEAFADAPRPDDAFCTPTERRAAPRPSSHADPPLMPCA